MRLAGAVHEQGYKVVLTGEGADEALAGYAWFKTQKIRDCSSSSGPIDPGLKRSASLALASIGGDRAHRPDAAGDPGHAHRPARRLRLHGARPGRSLYSRRHVEPAGRPFRLRRPGSSPTTGSRRWHPLNQSLYVGYKVMLAGLLLHGQGRPGGHELVGRGALPAPRRRRDRLLRVDRAGVQAARPDRQMAAAPGGRAHAAGADRQPAQDDVPRQPVRGVPRPEPPALGRPAPQPASRSRPPAGSIPRAWLASAPPRSATRGSRPGGSSWT